MDTNVTGFGTLGPMRVGQVGSHEQCGKSGCTVKAVAWRVILGQWRVQAYVCAAHLSWACALDMLSESKGKAMGWAYGYPTGSGTVEIRSTAVTPCMAQIKRVDYARVPDVSEQFPKVVMRKDDEGEHVSLTWS